MEFNSRNRSTRSSHKAIKIMKSLAASRLNNRSKARPSPALHHPQQLSTLNLKCDRQTVTHTRTQMSNERCINRRTVEFWARLQRKPNGRMLHIRPVCRLIILFTRNRLFWMCLVGGVGNYDEVVCLQPFDCCTGRQTVRGRDCLQQAARAAICSRSCVCVCLYSCLHANFVQATLLRTDKYCKVFAIPVKVRRAGSIIALATAPEHATIGEA